MSLRGETAIIEAQCEGCGKSWKVPEAGRAYKCRECGGKVTAVAAEAPAEEPKPPVVSCRRCQTGNPPEAQFCERCGTRLGKIERPAVSGGQVERNMMLREFGRVRQIVSTLRILYVLGAVLLAIYVFAWVALGMSEGLTGSGVFLAVLGILVGLLALQVVGAFRVAREPFFWSVVIAGFATLGLVIYLATSEFSILPVLIRGGWVLLLWGGVATAARLRDIIRANPDLAESLVGGHHRGALHAPGEAQQRFEARARAQRRQRLILLGSLLVAIPLAVLLVLKFAGPPGLEDRAADFATAWNAADLDGLEPFFTAKAWENDRDALERKMKQRGWTRLPEVGEPRIEEGGAGPGEAIFPLPKGELRTRWELEDRRWILAGITFPEVEAGPADDTLRRFTEAWNGGTLEDIVGFFAQTSQEKQQQTLERIFGRRDWIATRPKIEESDLKIRGPGRARAYHVIDDEELRSDWEWQHPRWVLVGLRLPRR